MKSKLEKTQKILASIFGVIAIGFALLLIPAVQNLIILATEKFVVHRLLEDHGKWIGKMQKIGIIVSMPCALLWFLLFIKKDILEKLYTLSHKTYISISQNYIKLEMKLKEILPFRKIKDWIKENSHLKKVFLTFCILYVICFSAIIRANFYYIDDLGRSIYGYQSWDNFSRYGSNFLSTLIHTGKHLSDISPLTQFIAIIILSASSTILIHIFYSKKAFSFFACLSVLPLGISPYFLECISYKFDSPYMAFSILFMIIPLLFYKYDSLQTIILYGIVSAIGAILTCITYQAALGIFPIAVIFIATKKWNDEEDIKTILKFICISAISYIIGVLFFRIFIMKSVDTYVSSKIFNLKTLPQGCFSNLKRYYNLVKTDFKPIWKYIIAAICICYIMLTVLQNKNRKLLTFLISFAALSFSFFLAFGLYIALEKPLMAPRAMYGFGVLIALLNLQCFEMDNKYIVRFISISLSWCFISFAFDYGNALYEQKNWTHFRVAMVLSDLNEIAFDDNTRILQFSGSIGKSRTIQNRRQNFSMLNRLVPNTFDGSGWSWSQYYIRNYFGLRNFTQDNSVYLANMNLPILKDTMYHTIYGNNEYILVQLK